MSSNNSNISSSTPNVVKEEEIKKLYDSDKQNIEDFLNHKSNTFNFASLKRLVISELSYNKSFKYKKICGFTKQQILNMVQYPEKYDNYLVALSRFMKRRSGYFRRIVEYFVDSAVINWVVDTEIKSPNLLSFSENQKEKMKKDYIKFTAQCNKFKLDNRVSDIFEKLFVEDICYGFISENENDCSIFMIDPKYCQITKVVNGNVFEYAINRSVLNAEYFDVLPKELQIIINESYKISKNNLVQIPYENSLCLKYNNQFIYAYPPFISLIKSILDIDDYIDLAKVKTESDAYKILYFKIPTEDGKITMDASLTTPFIQMASTVVAESYGIIPAPMDLELIESKSTADDDNDKTDQAVTNLYNESGVSPTLFSQVTSAAEMKLSMKVDSSEIYRLYRQIESWMSLQMKLRGFIFASYDFVYSIMPMTIYDTDDMIDRELKLAQASIPNKNRLMASNGINTAKFLGNQFVENVLFKDIYDMFSPLATSYTQSSNDGGRPTLDDGDISEKGEASRESQSSDKDNVV